MTGRVGRDGMVMNCLILEDQVLLADLLARNLAAYPGLKVVGIAGSVAEGQHLCREHSPDLLVVDLMLPDGLGVEVAEQLIRDRPDARVIVLSAECQRLQCSRHLHNAIVAVIDKTEALEKLQHQVRRLLVEARLGGEGTDGGEAPAGAPAHWDRLTRREREVFQLIGEGLSSEAIAERLGLSVLTARTHRKHITSKLGIKGGELVLLASAFVRHAP